VPCSFPAAKARTVRGTLWSRPPAQKGPFSDDRFDLHTILSSDDYRIHLVIDRTDGRADFKRWGIENVEAVDLVEGDGCSIGWWPTRHFGAGPR
jgi:hypothetical protein